MKIYKIFIAMILITQTITHVNLSAESTKKCKRKCGWHHIGYKKKRCKCECHGGYEYRVASKDQKRGNANIYKCCKVGTTGDGENICMQDQYVWNVASHGGWGM